MNRANRTRTATMVVLSLGLISGCSESASEGVEAGWDQNSVAGVVVGDEVHMLRFNLFCQPPKGEKKEFNLLAHAAENDPSAGQLTVRGSVSEALIGFVTANGKIYHAQDDVYYDGKNLSWEGTFDIKEKLKTVGQITGSINVTCS